MALCESCGRDRVGAAPFSRRRRSGECEKVALCIACRVVAMAMGVTVTCTRAEVLQLRALADRRDKPTARYWGERMTDWREWMGHDNRWHAQLMLEDGTRVFLDEPE